MGKDTVTGEGSTSVIQHGTHDVSHTASFPKIAGEFCASKVEVAILGAKVIISLE